MPFTAKHREASQKTRVARADAKAANLKPIIRRLQAAGVTSYSGIAAELNRRNIPTATGRGQWQAPQIIRVLGRIS